MPANPTTPQPEPSPMVRDSLLVWNECVACLSNIKPLVWFGRCNPEIREVAGAAGDLLVVDCLHCGTANYFRSL